MKLVHVDRTTEATFLRCLHDEEPEYTPYEPPCASGVCDKTY